MRTLIAFIAASIAASSSPLVAQRTSRSQIQRPAPAGRASTDQDRRGNETTERFSQRVRVGANGRVTLSNITGAIVVSGGSGSEVSIEAVKRTRGTRELLNDVAIEVEERNGRVDIRTRHERQRNTSWRDGVSVDYTLTIPGQTAIDITSISGAVSVTSVRGLVSVQSSSGSVTLAGLSRLDSAKSISGSVTLSDSTLEEDADLATTSGAILVRDVKARALELKAVSGRIEASGLTSERLDMSTLSGRMTLTGRAVRNGRYNLSTHSGSVQISLAGDPGFELRANTFSGSISSDFNMTRQEMSGRDERGRPRMARSLRGTVGDGSATISVQTFSGSIRLQKRP